MVTENKRMTHIWEIIRLMYCSCQKHYCMRKYVPRVLTCKVSYCSNLMDRNSWFDLSLKTHITYYQCIWRRFRGEALHLPTEVNIMSCYCHRRAWEFLRSAGGGRNPLNIDNRRSPLCRLYLMWILNNCKYTTSYYVVRVVPTRKSEF